MITWLLLRNNKNKNREKDQPNQISIYNISRESHAVFENFDLAVTLVSMSATRITSFFYVTLNSVIDRRPGNTVEHHRR